MAREVYLLLGQSNMQGRDKTQPYPTYANASKISMFTQPWDATDSMECCATNPAAGTWKPASDPLHSNPATGVGPGMAFADKLIDLRGDPALEIGLVPCAWSGSQISDKAAVAAPQWISLYRSWTPFGMTVARLNAAKSWGPIKGILWHQGETDALNPVTQSTYYWPQELMRLMRDLRCELGDLTIPFIAGKLGPLPTTPYASAPTINAYLDQMVAASPSKFAVVEASDLALMADNTHFTQASAVTLGHRYAAAHHNMRPAGS